MSHVAFTKSQRYDRLNDQENEIDTLRADLNRDLEKARANGDWDTLREVKSKLTELDNLEDMVEDAKDLGEDIQRHVFGDESFFQNMAEVDNVSDTVAERLGNLVDEEVGSKNLGTSDKDSSSSSSSSSRSSSSSAKDGKYWLNLQRTDPTRFEKEINELEGPAQTNAYTNLQNEVQKENRFWTMMTNLQQANHDTLKAFIGNFRV